MEALTFLFADPPRAPLAHLAATAHGATVSVISVSVASLLLLDVVDLFAATSPIASASFA